MSDWASRFLAADAAAEPYPNISAEEPALELDAAYAIQAEYARRRGARIAGFKAGLTGVAAQRSLGIDTPVAGILFDDYRYRSGDRVRGAPPLMLETEIGFVIGTDIRAPMSTAEMLGCMRGWAPMLELASLRLRAAPTVVDLVATNTAAWGFVEGTLLPCAGAATEAVEIRCEGPDGELHQARADRPLDALAWLVDRLLALGHVLRPGQVLLTGALGPPQPAHPGWYRATYGGLGEVRIQIAPS